MLQLSQLPANYNFVSVSSSTCVQDGRGREGRREKGREEKRDGRREREKGTEVVSKDTDYL